MAEMKNLDQTLRLTDLVVNKNWGVHQLSHSRSFTNEVTDAGESAEQVDVVEQALAKTGRSLVIVQRDMPYDLGQIA
jgi:hypothetical protein